MKKVYYVFMIGLTLINFWGCVKKSTDPNANEVVIKTEVAFSYLNNNYEVVEDKTDNLWMKIKGVSETLSLVSSKTNNDEYTAILTDEENKIIVAMVYKNGKNFPDYITFAKDEQVVRGTASDYINGAFDILWEFDGSQEVFYNIELTNNIEEYNDISSLDKIENYQAKTIITSLKIWNAINNYVQDTDNKPNTRFFFIFGIIAAIASLTTVVVSTAVTIAVIGIVAVAALIITGVKPKRAPVNVVPTPETPASYLSVPIFLIKHNGIDVKDGEIFTIDYRGPRLTIALNPNKSETENQYIKDYHSRLTFNPIYSGNHTEKNNVDIFAHLKGTYGNPNSIIDGYYRFYFDEKESIFENKNSEKINTLQLEQSNYIKLDVDKINQTPSDMSNVVLKFIFTNTVEIYGRMSSNLSIEFN